MTSSSEAKTVDELLDECHPTNFYQRQSSAMASEKSNWILDSNRTLHADDQLAPFVGAIRSIQAVQNDILATLKSHEGAMANITATQEMIVKEFSALRQGNLELDEAIQKEVEETKGKHPDLTVRVLSASVRQMQTSQIQLRNLVGEVKKQVDDVLVKGKETVKDDDKEEGELPEAPLTAVQAPKAKPKDVMEKGELPSAPPTAPRAFSNGSRNPNANVSSSSPRHSGKQEDRTYANLAFRLGQLEEAFDDERKHLHDRMDDKCQNLGEKMDNRLNALKDSISWSLRQDSARYTREYTGLLTDVQAVSEMCRSLFEILMQAQEVPGSPIYGVRKRIDSNKENEACVTRWRAVFRNTIGMADGQVTYLQDILHKLGNRNLYQLPAPLPGPRGVEFIIQMAKWYQDFWSDLRRRQDRFQFSKSDITWSSTAETPRGLLPLRKRGPQGFHKQQDENHAKRRAIEGAPRRLSESDRLTRPTNLMNDLDIPLRGPAMSHSSRLKASNTPKVSYGASTFPNDVKLYVRGSDSWRPGQTRLEYEDRY